MIIIDGQIGVGKTTLAGQIENTLKIPLYPELDTPISEMLLNRFYKDQARWSFSSQVHFLINRFQMIKDIQSKGGGVLDRSIYGDSIFAEVQHEEGYMVEEEFVTYKSLRDCFLKNIKPPRLLIYLDCNIDNAMSRIKNRNRTCECEISREYLEKINKKYLAWYNGYASSPKLFIDTNNLNINHEKDATHAMTLIQNKLKETIPVTIDF